jgi:LPXTG-motif cell wall-anchored protein
LTITTSDSAAYFGIGGKFTFTNTGIAGLDKAKLIVDTRIDNKNFTATVPAGITDLDPSQAGDQTTVTFTSKRPYAIERDEVGALHQIHFGTTTVDGKDAYALTWYRTATYDNSVAGENGTFFPAINPRNLTFTIQLVIIKLDTGSDADGWDFGFEYNIGHANDISDGYRSDLPTSGCSLSNRSLCRWGMGVVQYVPAGPDVPTAYAVAYELFPDNSILELGDSAGATALVRNSLNSRVLGRYTFNMIGGAVTGFVKPTLGIGISGTVPPLPVEETPAAETPAAQTPAAPAATTTTPQLAKASSLPKTGNTKNNGLLAMSVVLMLAGTALTVRKRNVSSTR